MTALAVAAIILACVAIVVLVVLASIAEAERPRAEIFITSPCRPLPHGRTAESGRRAGY